MTGLGATAAWPLTTRSQPSAKIPRIGYLTPGLSTIDLGRRNVAALHHGLNELGYYEGQNIAIEYRFAEGDFDRLPNLAAELVRLNVAIIVAGPTPAAVAAWKATRTIPIVMINVGDPVGLGLIASLARPGGNVTGLAFTVGTDTFGKGRIS
jgi:putative tryptophan/tyrosine transport system substrate-binding protein